ADARDRRDRCQRRQPPARGDTRGARGAVRAGWLAAGLRCELRPSAAAEGEVPHLVTEPLAAPLQARRLTLRPPRHEAAVRGKVVQLRDRTECREHLERVRLPVRGDTQHPARGESLGEQLCEWTLQQAALVMALLRPGVRKEYENLLQPLR